MRRDGCVIVYNATLEADVRRRLHDLNQVLETIWTLTSSLHSLHMQTSEWCDPLPAFWNHSFTFEISFFKNILKFVESATYL